MVAGEGGQGKGGGGGVGWLLQWGREGGQGSRFRGLACWFSAMVMEDGEAWLQVHGASVGRGSRGFLVGDFRENRSHVIVLMK